MKDPKVKPDKKPAQVLLALGMLFHVKDKLKRESWMVAREVYNANPVIMSRIKKVIETDYGYDVQAEHLYEAIVMLLVGMNVDVTKRVMR